MIVRMEGDALVIVRQTDHAALSGALASAWGNALFPVFDRRDSTIVAAYRHDDGWADWELAPSLGTDGKPVDFIRIPVPEHVDLYRRGIDLVEREDPYAGCVVSLHGKRLYTRPFLPGGQARFRQLKDDRLSCALGFIAHEEARERRLLGALSTPGTRAAVRADIEEAWRLLQVWDRISLFACLSRLGSGASFELPAVRTARGDDGVISVSTPSESTVVLDPYPLDGDPADFSVDAIELPSGSWTDEAGFRVAYRSAERRAVPLTVRRG